MIPTKYREKLPRSLAYPVGAALISDALASVPQLDELQLHFASNRTGQPTGDGKHLVLTAGYRKTNLGLSASHDWEEAGLYGPAWDVWVYAVPQQLNRLVRRAMVDHGLSKISDWLSQPRSELWLTTSHRCRLWYHPDEDRLAADENDARGSSLQRRTL